MSQSLLSKAVYSGLMYVAAPVVFVYLVVRTKYRRLLGRFWPRIEPNSSEISPNIWIHAASLGEVNTATPLAREFTERWPNRALVLTASTITGMDAARKVDGVRFVTWCPFDLGIVTKHFVRHLQSQLLVLIETELWPNLIWSCSRRGVPVVIANGRISEKHFRRYLRIRWLISKAAGDVTMVCAQTEQDAERFACLGVARERIRVLGNTKFDGAARSVDEDVLCGLRNRYAFRSEVPMIVVGSSRPGDEHRALRVKQALAGRGKKIQMVIVPRHIERSEEIVRDHPDVDFIRHRADASADTEPLVERDAVLLVDTVGELTHFYALGDLAIIGGSFTSEVQGHNPVEAAALGIPVLFGPCMKNFHAPAMILVEAGAAVQVVNEEALIDAVDELLGDANRRREMSKLARSAVDKHSGAVAKTVDVIESLLES